MSAATVERRERDAVLIRYPDLSRKDQHLVIATSKAKESGPRKKLRVHGTKGLPDVDVLLPCCGEDVDVIMATVRAACALDYPTSCFRVRVLDDGGSAALKAAVSALQSQWSHVSYHSRGRQSGMVFAKSGNLNYALTTLQNETPPEFCAILDADSVPCPHFLRATLPHLLQSPDAALVSTRQYFSNLPNGDPLSQTRSHFYTCQNAALDVLGLAIDAGSGAVFRRSAIVQVGLYPTFSFSEDWQLSQILHGNGWRTYQVQEPLQFGLVPDSLTGHCAQRNRWNIGHAQQIPAMLSSDYKHYTKSLRWSVIWDGFGIVAGEVECFFGFLAIPLLLLSGQLIPTTYPALVKAQIFMAVCQVSVMWIYEYVQAALNNFQSAPFAHLENKWLAGRKFLFSSIIHATISTRLIFYCSEHTCHLTILPRLRQAQGIFLCHRKRSQFLEPTRFVGVQENVPRSLEKRRLLQFVTTPCYRLGCLSCDNVFDGRSGVHNYQLAD